MRIRPAALSTLVFGCSLGCGPSLAEEVPDSVTGLYRAEPLEITDSCAGAGVPSDAGYSWDPETVPLRAGEGWLDLPESAAIAGKADEHTVVAGIQGFRLVRLPRDASGYAHAATRPTQSSVRATGLFSCGESQFSWTATVLDEETIHVEYEGSYCHGDLEASEVCRVTQQTEYTLDRACPAPCDLVDDRDTDYPELQLPDDVLIRPVRCQC